jgi:hypothetical protein
MTNVTVPVGRAVADPLVASETWRISEDGTRVTGATVGADKCYVLRSTTTHVRCGRNGPATVTENLRLQA